MKHLVFFSFFLFGIAYASEVSFSPEYVVVDRYGVGKSRSIYSPTLVPSSGYYGSRVASSSTSGEYWEGEWEKILADYLACRSEKDSLQEYYSKFNNRIIDATSSQENKIAVQLAQELFFCVELLSNGQARLINSTSLDQVKKEANEDCAKESCISTECAAYRKQ